MSSEHAELVGFLKHQNPAVRAQACQLLLGLSGGADQAVFTDEKLGVIAQLCRMVSDRVEVSKMALSTLVNLSSDEGHRKRMLDAKAIDISIALIRDAAYETVHQFVCMLLSNLTIEEAGAKAVMQAGSGLQGLNMRRLLQKFIQPIKAVKGGSPDPYEYVANILTNVTQIPEGRQMLTDKQRNLVQHLLPQLKLPRQHENRRIGTYRSIRNCFMDLDLHPYLLAPERGLLLPIMLPLTGPSPDNTVIDDEDKQGMPEEVIKKIELGRPRESNKDIRFILLEITALCTRVKSSRKLLRDKKMYIVVRECHKQEKAEQNQEASDLIHDIVPFFILKEDDGAGAANDDKCKVEEVEEDDEEIKEAHPDEDDDDDEESEIEEGMENLEAFDEDSDKEESEEEVEAAAAAVQAPEQDEEEGDDDDDDLPPLHDLDIEGADMDEMD